MFLEGKRKQHQTCGNCGQMTHGQPDNIDPFKDELLNKLNVSGYFEGVPPLDLGSAPVESTISFISVK
jgi:hypothetical protein